MRNRAFFRGLVVLLVAIMLAGESARTADDVISARGSSSSETGLGNLVADAVRELANTDAALVPASRFREMDVKLTSLSPATVAAALVDPDERVQVLELTGAQVRAALERSLSLVPKPNAGFLQVSGINFRYDQAAGAGNRVGEIMLRRNRISDSQVLKVAMPKSLAEGGHGYFRIWGNAKPAIGDAGTVRTGLDRLFEGTIDPAKYLPDGRIRRL